MQDAPLAQQPMNILEMRQQAAALSQPPVSMHPVLSVLPEQQLLASDSLPVMPPESAEMMSHHHHQQQQQQQQLMSRQLHGPAAHLENPFAMHAALPGTGADWQGTPAWLAGPDSDTGSDHERMGSAGLESTPLSQWWQQQGLLTQV